MSDRRIGRGAVCLLVGIALLVWAGVGWAQTVSEGKITGTVFLPTGEALAGATVQVVSPALVTNERTTVTGDGGRFVFLSLPPGTYDINVSLEGFKTIAEAGVVIHGGDSRDFKYTMEIGAIEEEISVVGEAPLIDTRSSTIDTTFSTELLKAIPTARNAFYDLSLTAAGMSDVGKEGSWLPSPSAYGSATNENVFLVNGVDATNPRGASWGNLVNVNYNTVEEVRVLSLGSKAEYGSFSGAAIDVLTKSGGNEYHGDVSYYNVVDSSDNQTSSFGAGWLYSDPGDDLTTNVKTDWEANATLGGPIIRDKLWFYAGYDHLYNETDTPLFIPLQTYRGDLYDLKLTAAFGTSHRAWIAYHMEDTINKNNSWGDTWDPSMVYDTGHDNDTYSAQYQWVVTDQDLFSFKLLGFKTNDKPEIPMDEPNTGFINWWKWIGAQSIGVAGNFPYVEAQKSKRQTLQADFSHYADDFLGEHDVKFGVQYTHAEGNWEGGYFQGYANFAYPYPYNYGPATSWWWNCEATWCWGTDDNPAWPMYVNKNYMNPWLTVRKADNKGAFVDDSWVVSDRVTVNLGLRYDKMTAKYGEGKVYEMPQTPADINNPTVLRTRPGEDVFDFTTWSPRLGVAWTITEDGRTVLRAHAGRYYAPYGVESLRRFGPDMEPAVHETWMYLLSGSEVDLNGNGIWDFNEVRPATRLLQGRSPDWLMSSDVVDDSWDLRVAPGTNPTYTDQFNISIQRQLLRDLAVEVSYIYKKTKDMIVLEPYNPLTGAFYQWEPFQFTTWTGDQVTAYQIPLQDYNGDGVADFDDALYVGDDSEYLAVNAQDFAGQDISRTYEGLQVTVNKRYADRWQMLASVNYNQTDGFAPRPVDQNWYIDGPMVMDTPFGSNLNHFVNNTSGPLLMTPKWMIKISGSYTIPVIETDLGLRMRYDSGRAIFPIQSWDSFHSWMSGFDACPTCLLTPSWHLFMVASDPNNPDWMPATTIFDLSLNKRFDIGNRLNLAISVDALNAFNEDSPNKVGYFQGDYGRVYSVVRPRTIRLGAKLSF